MRYFVVISQQRAGSHLLMNLLNSHPAIHCNGDHLTADIQRYGEEWAYQQGLQVPSEQTPEVVGFLLKMHQDLHQTIRHRAGLKILFLHRQNRLATLLSRNVSHRLGAYIAPDRGIQSLEEAVERRRALSPLAIPIPEAEQFFEEWTAKTEEVRQSLTGTDWRLVLYEEVCRDAEAAMRPVYEHLGVSYHPVRHTPGPGAMKEDPRPLSEAIANYGELKAYFQGTHWESFFVE